MYTIKWAWLGPKEAGVERLLRDITDRGPCCCRGQPLRAGSTIDFMAVTVELPPATLRRLEAEAARRGTGIEVVITALAETLPAPSEPAPAIRHRFSFVGVAASGDGTLSERYKAIRRAEIDS